MGVPDAQRRDALLAMLGDAAVGARPWLEVTAELEQAFDVDMVSIEIADLAIGETRIITGKIDDAAQREYETHIFNLNPRVHVPDPKPLTIYAGGIL